MNGLFFKRIDNYVVSYCLVFWILVLFRIYFIFFYNFLLLVYIVVLFIIFKLLCVWLIVIEINL